jgi:hypothetical protein
LTNLSDLWTWTRLGFWRYAVAVSIAASILRSGPDLRLLPAPVWYALQFGPLAISAAFLLTRRTIPMRRIDVSLLICLALFALLALATSVTGLFHSQTLSQAGVLTFMFGFLALTLSKRWTSPEIIRGDLAVGFIVVCLAQAVGLVGLAARQPWAIADYGRFQGLFSNANYAGATSVIGIVVGSYIIQTMVGARRWLVLLGMLTLAGAKQA